MWRPEREREIELDVRELKVYSLRCVTPVIFNDRVVPWGVRSPPIPSSSDHQLCIPRL